MYLQKLSQVHYVTTQIHLCFVIHFQRKFPTFNYLIYLQKLSQVENICLPSPFRSSNFPTISNLNCNIKMRIDLLLILDRNKCLLTKIVLSVFFGN